MHSAPCILILRSKKTLSVPTDQSLLQAVRNAQIDVPFSCLTGHCGICQVRVLHGLPEHRDPVYSNSTRMPVDCIKLCVSRALSHELVIDL